MATRYGVVVIGMGIAGKVRVRDIGKSSQWTETQDVSLVGYVSRREVDIEGSKQLSFEDALARDDVHIAVICTENNTHFDYAKKCMEAGKHVLVEYPLATSKEQVKELQELAKEKGVCCHEEVISLLLDTHAALKEEISRRRPLVEGKLTASASYNGWIEKFSESGSPFTSSLHLLHGIIDIFGRLTPLEASLNVDDSGFSCSGKVVTTNNKQIAIELSRTAEKSPRKKTIYFKFEDGSVIDELPTVNNQPDRSQPGLFMRDFIQFVLMLDQKRSVSPSSEQTLHCHQVADGLYDLTKK